MTRPMNSLEWVELCCTSCHAHRRVIAFWTDDSTWQCGHGKHHLFCDNYGLKPCWHGVVPVTESLADALERSRTAGVA